MVRVFAMALLLLVGGASYSVPAEAAAPDGPKLKSLFQKKSKRVFKETKRNKKYHLAAAKKQRKAKWQRHSMIQ